MPQSNVIFFYLFAAFFVFITLRGELRKYMGFLFSTSAPSSTVTRSDLAAPSGQPDWDRLGKVAKVVGAF